MPQFYPVCSTNEVPPGQSRLFFVNETAIAVFHLGGAFYALANECPHAGASLAHGDIDGECVSCRIHHWRFDIRDGTYLDEDKPRYDAKSFAVRVINDQLEIDLDG